MEENKAKSYLLAALIKYNEVVADIARNEYDELKEITDNNQVVNIIFSNTDEYGATFDCLSDNVASLSINGHMYKITTTIDENKVATIKSELVIK